MCYMFKIEAGVTKRDKNSPQRQRLHVTCEILKSFEPNHRHDVVLQHTCILFCFKKFAILSCHNY